MNPTPFVPKEHLDETIAALAEQSAQATPAIMASVNIVEHVFEIVHDSDVLGLLAKMQAKYCQELRSQGFTHPESVTLGASLGTLLLSAKAGN